MALIVNCGLKINIWTVLLLCTCSHLCADLNFQVVGSQNSQEAGVISCRRTKSYRLIWGVETSSKRGIVRVNIWFHFDLKGVQQIVGSLCWIYMNLELWLLMRTSVVFGHHVSGFHIWSRQSPWKNLLIDWFQKNMISSLPGNSNHGHFSQTCHNFKTTIILDVQAKLQSWLVIVAHFVHFDVLSDICANFVKYLLIKFWTSYWTWQLASTWLKFFESFCIFSVGWRNGNLISVKIWYDFSVTEKNHQLNRERHWNS